jgi:electron transfer flavoprotein beta subunit
MKALVCFKSVPDPVDASRRIVNPFDEIAIEEALRLREAGKITEVAAVTIGAAGVEEQIRSALGMGCDRAIRIDDSRALDPIAIAKILAALALREKPSLVILGKQAIDDDSNQVGQMLAALLDWPQATFISKLELIENNLRARCTRETDAGLETIAVKLPAVFTTDLRLNEPRYVSLPGLMKARRKPIETISLGDLGVSVSPRMQILAMDAPASRPAGTRVASVEELVAKLRNEAKVI